jgi:hypothetical protein
MHGIFPDLSPDGAKDQSNRPIMHTNFSLFLKRRLSLVLVCLPFVLTTATAATSPNFRLFDDLLLRNVQRGFVDYDGLKADPRFPEFVDQLGQADPQMLDTNREQLAFYINAYNALVIKNVLDGLTPQSKRSRKQFFQKNKFLVLGEEMSLSTLEKERIIPIGDPRIHFAIACASLSCPRLSSNAYLSGDIDSQLHDAATRFINDPTRNRFDLERRIAFISSIFDTYGEAFSAAGGSVQQYMARFVNDARVQDALRLNEFELNYEAQDWSLNGNLND